MMFGVVLCYVVEELKEEAEKLCISLYFTYNDEMRRYTTSKNP